MAATHVASCIAWHPGAMKAGATYHEADHSHAKQGVLATILQTTHHPSATNDLWQGQKTSSTTPVLFPNLNLDSAI
jgi:hypothetical protein